MAMRRLLCAALFVCLGVGWAPAQDSSAPPSVSSSPGLSPPATVSLVVPDGTVLQVALEKETKVKKVGQPIEGLLVEPVYAFDQQVIPVGSKVRGRIVEIQGPTRKSRFLAALSLNFTPARMVRVEFDEIILPDGKHIPMKSAVVPGSGRTIRLVTTADNEKQRTAKDLATQRMREGVREAKRKWNAAMKQVKEPGKMRRLGRAVVAQLPIHPQYLDAGTVYFLELQEPLDFGTKLAMPPAAASDEDSLPPCSLLAHAQLLTPLDSATTPKDAPVEAIVTRPLFSGDRLLFPQGSLLKGSVVRVQPARSFKRNGQLRIGFTELSLPGEPPQEVTTSVEGIQAGEVENISLDSEGGTKSTSPKKRYVFTGAAVALAVASYEDSDVEDGVSSSSGNASQGATGGAVAFRLIGMVVGALVRSPSFSLGMGIFGAGRSAYSNFIARGRDVTFPKGTAVEVGFWLKENCDNSTHAPEPSGSRGNQ